MFYAEGKWDYHLDDFATLPERSILYHVDHGDIFLAHQKLHHKFALSGGIPNVLLSYGKPDEVRAHCRKVIDGVAKDGGYIMDASAIMQDDTSIENLRALTDFTREYGVYSAGSSQASTASRICARATGGRFQARRNGESRRAAHQAGHLSSVGGEGQGTCREITGDQDLVRRVWENVEALGNTYIWQLLLSF